MMRVVKFYEQGVKDADIVTVIKITNVIWKFQKFFFMYMGVNWRCLKF